MEINITKPFLPPFDKYLDKIKEIWNTNTLSNMGPLHEEFEDAVKQYTQDSQCILVCNGHLALELLIKSMNLTGEVITTPFTFVSTTNAIVRNGLRPVFCDIRREDFTLDPNEIEEKITDKTSAILPVHVYGNPCQTEQIQKIAQKHHLKVIYDAAHAFGVTEKGKYIASFGDASILSFHATKPMHSVEGGAVVCNDTQIAEKIRRLRNFGIDGEDVTEIGINAKMNEFQAAMGLCSLAYFDACMQRRKKLVECYEQHLSDLPGIEMQKLRADVKYNYAYLPIRVTETAGISRDALLLGLEEKGIHTRKYFYPLTCDMTCYKELGKGLELPAARQAAKEVLTLPLYDELTEDEVKGICLEIKSVVYGTQRENVLKGKYE